MAGRVPAIDVFPGVAKDVDGRHKVSYYGNVTYVGGPMELRSRRQRKCHARIVQVAGRDMAGHDFS